MAGVAGFWSYTREDDERSRGRIRGLADAVRDEYSLLSGSELDLFIDRDIKWGEEWQARINEALQRTTFLIPIITPRYFKSDACRKELLEFVAEARSLGVEKLLLPIYYAPVPELDADDPPDEAMAVIKRTEWQDMRPVRLKDEEDSAHREKVAELAERLIEITEEVEASGSRGGAIEVAGTGPSEVGEEATVDAAEGELLDRMAATEVGMPKIAPILTGLGNELKTLTSVAQKYLPKMEHASSFAAKLGVANRMAHDLDQPAGRIEERAQEYAAQLSEIDPGVMAMIRVAAEQRSSEQESVREFAASISSLVGASKIAMAQTSELVNVLDETSQFSRELQGPLKRIRVALRNVIDANAIMERWEERIDELGLLDGPEEDE